MIRVRLFASLREIVGNHTLEFEPGDDVSVADLWRRLEASHPDLAKYGDSIQFAVNQDFVASETRVEDDDEVAFLPPVSGG